MTQQLELTPNPQRPRVPLKYIIPLITLSLLVASALCILWIYTSRIVSDTGVIRLGSVPVTTPMSSIISETLVTLGQKVQKDQLLIKLDDTDYVHQYAAASALVHGSFALPTPEHNAARIAEIQALEEHLVKQIALARHEENAARTLVEQHSIAHARALLQMRNADVSHAPASQRQKTIQAEAEARQLLEQAQSFFEYTSRSRSAIEGELHNIRNDIAKAYRAQNTSPSMPASTLTHPEKNAPNLIHAPITGTVTDKGLLSGALPKVGETVQKDQVLLSITPEIHASLMANATVPQSDSESIQKNTLCFLILQQRSETLTGTVRNIFSTNEAASVGLDISVDVTGLTKDEAITTDLSARVVLWTHPWAHSPFLQPLLGILSHF